MMVKRRARIAGIATRINNDTFRATGITTYLLNNGTLEKAAKMANHASTRTTQLYVVQTIRWWLARWSGLGSIRISCPLAVSPHNKRNTGKPGKRGI